MLPTDFRTRFASPPVHPLLTLEQAGIHQIASQGSVVVVMLSEYLVDGALRVDRHQRRRTRTSLIGSPLPTAKTAGDTCSAYRSAAALHRPTGSLRRHTSGRPPARHPPGCESSGWRSPTGSAAGTDHSPGHRARARLRSAGYRCTLACAARCIIAPAGLSLRQLLVERVRRLPTAADVKPGATGRIVVFHQGHLPPGRRRTHIVEQRQQRAAVGRDR